VGDKHSRANEPTLEEMLSDPIVWMVMKSDKVEEHELRSLLKRVATVLVAEDTNISADETIAEPDGGYRRGVGIMLLNHRSEVLVGRRVDAQGDAWQMPQGGISEDEKPHDAAFRELKEEIGTDKARIIAESKTWLRYDLPLDMRKRWDNRWRGQQQKWFVMRFEGADADINIATEHPEFSAWKWIPIQHLPDLIVSFKRKLYLDLLREFGEAKTITYAHPPETPAR
jgi:putative (di)nucleoside polyphosphate hydrolase